MFIQTHNFVKNNPSQSDATSDAGSHWPTTGLFSFSTILVSAVAHRLRSTSSPSPGAQPAGNFATEKAKKSSFGRISVTPKVPHRLGLH